MSVFKYQLVYFLISFEKDFLSSNIWIGIQLIFETCWFFLTICICNWNVVVSKFLNALHVVKVLLNLFSQMCTVTIIFIFYNKRLWILSGNDNIRFRSTSLFNCFRFQSLFLLNRHIRLITDISLSNTFCLRLLSLRNWYVSCDALVVFSIQHSKWHGSWLRHLWSLFLNSNFLDYSLWYRYIGSDTLVIFSIQHGEWHHSWFWHLRSLLLWRSYFDSSGWWFVLKLLWLVCNTSVITSISKHG